MGAERRRLSDDGRFSCGVGIGIRLDNSMQQVRLVSAAPALASASVSLNTSVLYIGQAIGSAIGGLLYARELLHGIGYAGMAFVVLALATAISRSGSPELRCDARLILPA